MQVGIMSLCIIYFTGYMITVLFMCILPDPTTKVGRTTTLTFQVAIMPTTLQVTVVWIDLHSTYQLEQSYSTPNIEE